MRQPLRVHSRYLVFTSEYLLPLVIVIFVSLASYISLISPLLQIRSITCTIDYSPCAEGTLTAELRRYKGHNLLLFNPTSLQERLAQAEPTIGQIEIKKILPTTLVVELISVGPTFAIKPAGDDRFVVIDQDMRVIGLRDVDPHVPTLQVNSLAPLQIGSTFSAPIPSALTAMRLASQAYIPTHSFTLRDNMLEIELEEGRVGIISVTGELEPQISLLQAVLRDPKILDGVTSVDVRYTQPILK